jgi:hypothetical protein
MIPVGYMAKHIVERPEWLEAAGVVDTVSGCSSPDWADFINYWKHNGYWFFNTPEAIRSLAKEHSIDLAARDCSLTRRMIKSSRNTNVCGDPLSRSRLSPQEWHRRRKSVWKATMWSPSTQERARSVPRSPATRWRRKSKPISTACCIPRHKLSSFSKAVSSKKASQARTECSACFLCKYPGGFSE